MIRIFLTTTWLLFSLATNAQKVQDIFIYPTDNDKILSDFLHEKEDEYGVKFVFKEEQMRARTIIGIGNKTKLITYLQDRLAPYVVEKLTDDLVIIIKKDIAGTVGRRKENYIILKGTPGQNISIKGTVIDGGSDDIIIGAQVFTSGSKLGAVSDITGQYTLSVKAEFFELNLKFIGYQSKSIIIGFHPKVEKTTFNTILYQEIEQLNSVTVTAKAPDRNVSNPLTGVERMGIEAIKNLPTFMGEVDPIRSMTTLPGVSMVGELSSGFNVRGGETGQNLIFQDHATIYNPSHLFGFFSAFNPDLVNNVTLYKGGGPAQFGSRVSSVMDVSLKNGDGTRYAVSGGVGLISSRLTVEGPIKKGKSTFIVGGRLSYTDWLLNTTKNLLLTQSSAKFNDVTTKIFHAINEKNILTLTLYNSYDDFKFISDSIFSWQTTNASVLWDKIYNDNLFTSLSLASSNYRSQIQNLDSIDGFKYKNGINNLHLRYNLNYDVNDALTLLAGIEIKGIILEPGSLTPSSSSSNTIKEDIQNQHSIETAYYLQSDWNISKRWSLSAGLRASNFLRLGGEDIYVFDFNNIEQRYPVVSDTLSYDQGEIIESYMGLEPRVSLRHMVNEKFSIKLSYFRTFQYLHQISNTAAATPQDYWIASGPYLLPARGDQFSVGLFRNFSDNNYETSLEGFYKKTKHAVDYIEGADITLNPALEGGLIQGDAFAYGLEVLLKKNNGRINGWVSYTYSRSLRQFNASKEESRNINRGELYPANFDQPHNLSVITNYKFNLRTSLSVNFSYSTGRPITIPVSKFSYNPYLSVLNYSDRNAYRIPDYHRLDLSLTVKNKTSKQSTFKGEWVLSIYNLYGRKNAYSITFDKYGRANKVSILGSVFPSVAYNFKF